MNILYFLNATYTSIFCFFRAFGLTWLETWDWADLFPDPRVPGSHKCQQIARACQAQ